jgi:hypothetical protein
LDLDYAERVVDDSVLEAVGRHCKQLRRLYITGAHQVTDAAFSVDGGFLCECRSLSSLKLTGCVALSDAALRNVALRVPNLHEMMVGGLKTLTASALAELLVSCKSLVRLKAEMWIDVQSAAVRERQAASLGELFASDSRAQAGQQDDITSYRVIRNIDSALRYLLCMLPPGHVALSSLEALRAERGVSLNGGKLKILHDDHLVR